MEGIRFEKVSRFKDVDLPLPTRGTEKSAGYDFVVAEDTVLKPYEFFTTQLREGVAAKDYWGFINPLTLEEMAKATKDLKCKVQLVSTGMKAYMPDNVYLKLVARSSTPLKHWIIVANAPGTIDADYVQADNEGEIFMQLINLSPFAIQLKRGDKICQGIFCKYETTEDDATIAQRTGGFGSTGSTVSKGMTDYVREHMEARAAARSSGEAP